MYKILFIDEQQGDIDDFKDYVDATTTTENISVVAEYPLESLDEMIQEIFKHNPDAVITDFMLNEYKEAIKYNVPYNGVELVRELTRFERAFLVL
jgi:DNA-binding NarL/FixJ family response regulator